MVVRLAVDISLYGTGCPFGSTEKAIDLGAEPVVARKEQLVLCVTAGTGKMYSKYLSLSGEHKDKGHIVVHWFPQRPSTGRNCCSRRYTPEGAT